MKYQKNIELAQRALFGYRFEGATLSNIDFPGRSPEIIVDWLKKMKNFLIVVGPPGTGKTYFCSAVLDSLAIKNISLRAYNERKLLRKVRNSISDLTRGDYLETLHLLIDDDFIILDDVGSSGHTAWREEILMETIDIRYESTKPTLITSNLSQEEFYKTYGPRITSRLFAKENTIIDLFESSDLRTEGK